MTERLNQPPLTKDGFLRGETIDQYFDHTKKGDNIIPSSFDSSGLSADIRKLFAIKTMKDNGDIYIYNDDKEIEHYENHGRQELRVIIKKVLGGYYEEKFAKATIDDITASTTVIREKQEPPLYLLSFKNGLLNIDYPEYKLTPHTPVMFFTSNLPVNYRPNIGQPTVFLKFLKEVIPDAKIRQRIQEYVGYMLYRRNFMEIAVILFGHEDSGKSTFCNVVTALLGDNNVTSISIQQLSTGNFSKAQLYHKFALIRAENPSISIRDAGILKAIITGDKLNVNFKYGKLFDLRPYAKVLIGVNTIPYSKDTTRPFIKRWDLIECPNRFQGANCDRFLIDKLTTPDELSKILNWALEGLRRLLKTKTFTGLKSIDERKKIWLLGSSSLYKFCQDHVEEDRDQFEPKEYFDERYWSYCETNDLIPLDRNVIAKEIVKIFPKVRTFKPKIEDKQVACWKGIMIVKKQGGWID